MPLLITGTGMDGWTADIARLAAGDSLDKLVRSVDPVQKKLIKAINERGKTLKGFQEASSIRKEALQNFGPPMIGFVPNFRLVPAMTAYFTAKKSLDLFAREDQTLLRLSQAFTHISAKLTEAGLFGEAAALDGTIRQINRFLAETDDVFAGIEEFSQAKRKITQEFERSLAVANVEKNDYGNPRWFQIFLAASERAVPSPKELNVPQSKSPLPIGVAGSGLGIEPATTTLLLAALIKLVLAVGVVLAMIAAVNQLVPDVNSRARTANNLILEAERRKRQVEREMRRQGKSEEEIKERLSEIDEEVKDNIEKLPAAPSVFGAVLGPVGIVAGAFVALKALKVI